MALTKQEIAAINSQSASEQNRIKALPVDQQKIAADQIIAYTMNAGKAHTASGAQPSPAAGTAPGAASPGTPFVNATAGAAGSAADRTVLGGFGTGINTATSPGANPNPDPNAAYLSTSAGGLDLSTVVGDRKNHTSRVSPQIKPSDNPPILGGILGGALNPGTGTTHQTTGVTQRTAGDILRDIGADGVRNPDWLKSVQEKLLRGGFYGNGVTAKDLRLGSMDDLTTDALKRLLGETARTNDAEQKAGKSLSGWQDILGKGGPANAADGGGSGAKGTPAHDEPNKQIDIADPEQVHGIIQGALQQALGRNPTQAESEDFLAAVQHAYAQNPKTWTTHYNAVNPDGTGGGQTTTVTNEGMSTDDLNQMATNQAQQMPDYGAYQAATTYFNALQSALKSPV